MRTDKELKEVALVFISDSSTPQSVFEYAAELETLGAHGAKIPKLRANQWKSVIEELIDERKLDEVNSCVVVPFFNDVRQLDLF